MPRIRIEFIDGQMYNHDLDNDSMTPVYAAVSANQDTKGILRVASSKTFIQEEDRFSPTAVNAVETMQTPEFLGKFKLENPDNPSELLNEHMQHSKLSLGLLKTLYLLDNVAINLMVDDSGSMDTASDIPLEQMHPQFLKEYNALKLREQANRSTHNLSNCISKDGQVLTRWGEASNQLFSYVDSLSCVPTGTITVRYFNRPATITITPDDRKKYTVAELKQKIYRALWEQIIANKWGSTPTCQLLQNAFDTAKGETAHVLITDGTPSDCPLNKIIRINNKSVHIYSKLIELVRTRGLGYGLDEQQVIDLATNRQWKEALTAEKHAQIEKKSKDNPLTLLSCTKEDLTYFDTLDKDSDYVDAMDDFQNEAIQVRAAQGPDFPYNKSVWELKQLVGAKSKLLDALDESSKMYTKEAYSLFTGYEISEAVFQNYIAFKQRLNAGTELTWVAANGEEKKYSATQSHVSSQPFLDDDRPVVKSAATIAPNMTFMPPPSPAREDNNAAVSQAGCGCIVS